VAKIFISYRHADTSYVTGRIFDQLSKKIGRKNIFKDVESIQAGSDFKETINNSVKSCEVILAVIGPKWSTVTDDGNKRRIDDPNDFVRIEIEAGLKRGIPIIPVLVSGAKMPNSDELPETLKNLAFQKGLPVRSDPDFNNDIATLTESLKKIVSSKNNKYYHMAFLLGLTLLVSPFISEYFNKGTQKTTNNSTTTGIPKDTNTQTTTGIPKDTNTQTTTGTPKDTSTQITTDIPKHTSPLKTTSVDLDLVSKALIENFDINSIKLGMKPDEIKKLIDCNYDEYGTEVSKSRKIVGDHHLTCSKQGNLYFYYFDDNKKLFNMSMSIFFGEKKPDWIFIKEKLLKKYKTPTLETTTIVKNQSNKNIDQYHYCWGECYIVPQNTDRIKGEILFFKRIGFGLKVDLKLSSKTNGGVKEDNFIMSLALRDSKAYMYFHEKRYPKKVDTIDIGGLEF
jgi:hypothetical protein